MGTEPSDRAILVRWWWLHPLLIAAFPILFLFAENIGEQVSLDPLIAPLAAAVAGAAGLLVVGAGLARLAGSTAARAALLVSLLVALFFAYGHVWPAVEDTLRLHRNLLAMWGGLAVLGTLLAVLAPIRYVRAATAGLNVAAVALVVMNVIPIAGFQLAAGIPQPGEAAASERATLMTEGARPDIWYLVFDRYAGQDALLASFGYDNGPFLRELEARGFVIAEHATANYLKTAHSLASTFAMDYLDTDALAAEAATSDDWAPLYRRLQESYAVERGLHDRGYTYVHVGVRRGATYTNAAADRVITYADHTEFSAVLLETTLLISLENVLEDTTPIGTRGVYGRQTLYQLDVLEQLARAGTGTPRYVFAHVLLPHLPYVFNADGTWVTDEQAAARTSRDEYVEQLRFANDRILRMVDVLLERSGPDAPVILIQADEGPYPERYDTDQEAFDWTQATDAELLEKFSILAAYHVPPAYREALEVYPTITPVNSFRLIFNAVFDAGLPPLPDRNLVFPSQRTIYELIDVTDRVAGLR